MKSIIFLSIISFTFIAPQIEELNPIKEKAFEILETKCNVCHLKKNKTRVFTLDNMDRNSKKIYRQVFKWKRMPKEDEIKLTKKEYTQLKNWLSSVKKK